MPIQFQCPSCKTTLRVPDESAGKQAKCKCGTVVRIPASSSATSAQPATTQATAATANQPRPAAQRPASARPTPASTQASNMNSLFDELTDEDWKTKSAPIAKPEKASNDGSFLKAYIAKDKDLSYDANAQAATSQSTPKGLIILCVINGLIAAGLGVLGIILIVMGGAIGQLEEQLPLIRTMYAFIVVLVFFIASLYAFIAASLVIPQRWAWWVSATMYTYNVIDKVVWFVIMAIEGSMTSRVAGRNVSALLFAIGVMSYLYQTNVRNYFKVKMHPGVGFAICAGIAVLLSAIEVGVFVGMGAAFSSPTPP